MKVGGSSDWPENGIDDSPNLAFRGKKKQLSNGLQMSSEAPRRLKIVGKYVIKSNFSS